MAESQPSGVASATSPAYEQFLHDVQEAADTDRGGAERAARAVLQTLAERLSAGEARDLAERLAPEIAPWVAGGTRAEPFEADEFLRRVAEREHVDIETAERHARAAILALSRAVGPDEFDDMVAELPTSFAPLLARGERVEVMPAEVFIRRVAQRAALGAQAAEATTAAVLETLGERITRGEVEDLIAQLPQQLHEPLRRGDQRSSGAARRMDLDGFVRAVAEREGVEPLVAREHARAVLATLREAVTPKEWYDLTAQLPAEFAAVSARP